MLSEVKGSLRDDIGRVLEGPEKFYRAINPDLEDCVLDVIHSGLIDRLVDLHLFPETSVSSRKLEGFELVLEHRKIGFRCYPFEWSPEMLRAAGVCLAKVNDICSDYGFELKDAHPFNVVFDGARPVFVDFGSIVRLPERKRDDWRAAGEFVRMFRFPLYFYAKGAGAFFRRAFLVPGKPYSYGDYLAFRFGVLRILPDGLFQIIERIYESYMLFPLLDSELVGRRWGKFAQSLVKFVQSLRAIPLRHQSSKNLGRRLESTRLLKKSTWSDYQTKAGFLSEDERDKFGSRFSHVLELVNRARPRNVTELACNQGVLGEKISQLSFIESVVCCDIDEQAIDSLFLRLKPKNLPLTPMVLDFMLPKCNVLAEPVAERICADMVIALAVTHHLALTQRYRFDVIFAAIAKYTHRHAIVEFMPLGLWDGHGAPPIPSWYSEESFKKGLEPFFTILDRTQIQDNRVVFFLEKSC